MDGALHTHLSQCSPCEDGTWLFCHRWVLLHLRREFPLTQVVRLWDRIWACHNTSMFHIWAAYAILHACRDTLLGIQSPDMLLKVRLLPRACLCCRLSPQQFACAQYLQDQSMKIDLDKIL